MKAGKRNFHGKIIVLLTFVNVWPIFFQLLSDWFQCTSLQDPTFIAEIQFEYWIAFIWPDAMDSPSIMRRQQTCIIVGHIHPGYANCDWPLCSKYNIIEIICYRFSSVELRTANYNLIAASGKSKLNFYLFAKKSKVLCGKSNVHSVAICLFT